MNKSKSYHLSKLVLYCVDIKIETKTQMLGWMKYYVPSCVLLKFNSLLNQIQFHTQAESMYNRK